VLRLTAWACLALLATACSVAGQPASPPEQGANVASTSGPPSAGDAAVLPPVSDSSELPTATGATTSAGLPTGTAATTSAGQPTATPVSASSAGLPTGTAVTTSAGLPTVTPASDSSAGLTTVTAVSTSAGLSTVATQPTPDVEGTPSGLRLTLAPTPTPRATPELGLPLRISAALEPPAPRAGTEFLLRLTVTNDGDRPTRGVYIATSGPWERWSVLEVSPPGTFARDAAGWHFVSPLEVPAQQARTVEVRIEADAPSEEQLTFAVREAEPGELR